MAECVGVVGRSGSGKTRSIQGLDPKETLIISVSGKKIPMKGFNKLYTPLDVASGGATGNYFKSKSADTIIQILSLVDKKRPDIKNVVIDDYQYIMGFEFFDRADEKGFEKFASIGKNGARPLMKASQLEREDIKVFVLTHEEETSENFKPLRKMKTIGKMVDEKLTMEGLFTVVLFTDIRKDKDDRPEYGFITHSDGTTTAKSPEGMFKDDFVENDLGKVVAAIDKYYGE
jgi:ABC-type dipeptide/oligopeptide/nickel transport system ATPase component